MRSNLYELEQREILRLYRCSEELPLLNMGGSLKTPTNTLLIGPNLKAEFS